jgi:hypothetical protein
MAKWEVAAVGLTVSQSPNKLLGRLHVMKGWWGRVQSCQPARAAYQQLLAGLHPARAAYQQLLAACSTQRGDVPNLHI